MKCDTPGSCTGLCVSGGRSSSGISGCIESLSVHATLTAMGCSCRKIRCAERCFSDCPSGMVTMHLDTSRGKGVDFSAGLRDLVKKEARGDAISNSAVAVHSTLNKGKLGVRTRLGIVGRKKDLSSGTGNSGPSVAMSNTSAIALVFTYNASCGVRLPDFHKRSPRSTIATEVGTTTGGKCRTLGGSRMTSRSTLFSHVRLKFGRRIPAVPASRLVGGCHGVMSGGNNRVPARSRRETLRMVYCRFKHCLAVTKSERKTLPAGLRNI